MYVSTSGEGSNSALKNQYIHGSTFCFNICPSHPIHRTYSRCPPSRTRYSHGRFDNKFLKSTKPVVKQSYFKNQSGITFLPIRTGASEVPPLYTHPLPCAYITCPLNSTRLLIDGITHLGNGQYHISSRLNHSIPTFSLSQSGYRYDSALRCVHVIPASMVESARWEYIVRASVSGHACGFVDV